MKTAKELFTIVHTARAVNYHIDGFRNKNLDNISTTILEAINGSTNRLLVEIFNKGSGEDYGSA